MKIAVWGIEPTLTEVEKKAQYLVDTAKWFNVDIDFIGVGKPFTTFTKRLDFLREYLCNISPEEIVLVMDGYDTLINNSQKYVLESFLKKNTSILISAEKIYTYQWDTFKDVFNKIDSEYRYVNAGTYMGYVKDLKSMLDDLSEIYKQHPTDIDQGLLGIWVYRNILNKEKVQLDTNCEVFWVTSADWETLSKVVDVDEEIINPFTKTTPFVIHNTGNGDTNLYKSYQKAYNKIKLSHE